MSLLYFKYVYVEILLAWRGCRMLGSVSAGRNQLSSKQVVQPEERRLLVETQQDNIPFKTSQSLCTIIAPLRPSNRFTLFVNPQRSSFFFFGAREVMQSRRLDLRF